MCQCYGNNGKTGCPNEALPNSPFCQQHENTCPDPPTTEYEPTVEDLHRYDEPLEVRRSHNCYSAAMMALDDKLVKKCRDSKNNTSVCRSNFHQPGARFGGRFTLNSAERRTCGEVMRLVMEDNPDIKPTTFYQGCPQGMSMIHTEVDEGNDFHFKLMMRQKKDKTRKQKVFWGHKPGSNKTSIVDALGKPIFNPELASSDYRWQGSELNYKPCGFLCVPRNRKIVLGSAADDPRRSEQPQDGGRRVRRQAQSLIPMVGLGWDDPKHMRRLSRWAQRLAKQRQMWTRRRQRAVSAE
jgi:hypothetical protein